MDMFRIGEFSRLAKVTVDTLRYYDALGLLKPAHVDRFTAYRYYSAQQLSTVNHILALKELGLSLDEIAHMLSDASEDERLVDLLRTRLAEAEEDVVAAQARRDRITARLNFFQQEENMPSYEVVLKSIDACTVAAIQRVVPTVGDMPAQCGEMFGMIAAWMAANKLPFGPSLTVYYDAAYERRDIDTECAFVIPDAEAALAATPVAPIAVRQLDAIPQAATTVVTDDFHAKIDGLTPAYNEIARWIEANGYRMAGPPREIFHGSPETGDLTAEIQFPVEKA